MNRCSRTLHVYVACALLVLGAAAAWSARAAEVERDAPPPTKIRDLDYGDVLFHFFQDDWFESLVRLEANRDFGRMNAHAGDAELLSGGLYLSLGLHDEATRIFEGLLAGPVAPQVRDRAWFYLARVNHQRGRDDAALRSLANVRGTLPGKLEPERRLLEANVLMALGLFDEAAARLATWTDTSGWAHYARFNLGVARVRSGDLPRGRVYLDQVGQMVPANEEQASLRDRANLALGFALLQQQGGDEAAVALNRVRLDGPFTNRALLALGWAEANANRPERALVPWLELQQRKLLDAPVQESLLAVPYAYVKLAANGQASQHYRAAVDAYAIESRRLEESIGAIRGGGFLDAILEASPKENQAPGWFWQLEALPDAPHTRYLYHLLASHEFQEGLKNYRDLRLMQANLARWQESLEAFAAMIDAREQADARRAPRRDEALGSIDLDALERRHVELSARFDAAVTARDLAEFAAPAERAAWDALARVATRIEPVPPGTERDALAERARLLRGVVLWDLDKEFKVRSSDARRELQGAAAELAEARQRLTAVAATTDVVPQGTAGFAGRVAELQARVVRISPAIDATALAQERVLADLAVRELQAQQKRLAGYATQAQFALASLYDGAVVAGGGR